MEECKEFKHLPTNVAPSHYDLKIKLDITNMTFEGNCKINVDVLTATSNIVLNALNLSITKASYTDASGNEQDATAIEISDSECETVTFNFANNLPNGIGELLIDYNGQVAENMKGIYKCKYNSPEGEDRFGIATQFQATDARKCFPCFDEPSLKATFAITLIVPQDRLALSNMNIISETELGSNLREVKFATTPKMSTYILAFVVGNYDYVEEKTEDGLPIRVYTPVGKKEQGLFALKVAKDALKFYSDYFKIGYPLPKLDLITIPDFYFAAMENWGLITFRERCLLMDPLNSSTSVKQFVALCTAHEIAHMWFGNLTTMKWWNNLWLNESTATFFQYLCVSHLFPEYDIFTQFANEIFFNSMELDALDNSHPVEVAINNPNQIDELIDNISYGKGGSLIKMLYTYLGHKDFGEGMHIYLKEHSYKNTVTEDLWKAFEGACDKPISRMMDSWIKQKGFPLVTVVARHDGDKRIITLTQKKFSISPSTNDKTLWVIPVSLTTKSSTEMFLLESETADFVLEGLLENDWVKVNSGNDGFYRVFYSKDTLNQLFQNISYFSPVDRLGLHDDIFALSQAGLVPTGLVLKNLLSYKSETNFVVWASISSCLQKLQQLILNEDFHDQFCIYCQRLYRNIYKKVQWLPKEGESHTYALLRSLVLVSLISFKDDETINEGKKYFDDLVNGTVNIPADLRSAIYKAATSVGNEKTLQQMINLYNQVDSNEEKNRIGGAMGLIPDANLLRKVLEFSISSSVRAQDGLILLLGVSSSKLGRELAWEFVKENFSYYKVNYKGFLAARIVKQTTEEFTSLEKAREIEDFFEKNPLPGTERALNQSLETIRFKCAWLAREANNMKKFLFSC